LQTQLERAVLARAERRTLRDLLWLMLERSDS
jgi:hypothetical protein